jgi:hypothetical protein
MKRRIALRFHAVLDEVDAVLGELYPRLQGSPKEEVSVHIDSTLPPEYHQAPEVCLICTRPKIVVSLNGAGNVELFRQRFGDLVHGFPLIFVIVILNPAYHWKEIFVLGPNVMPLHRHAFVRPCGVDHRGYLHGSVQGVDISGFPDNL